MVCESCRSEIEPMMVICPACGARIAAEPDGMDWREHVRETVERHKEKKRLEQEKRDERARQLSIFPDAEAEDVEKRAVRERHAEIRARVERRLQKRRPASVHASALDAGEVSISREGLRARSLRTRGEQPPRSEQMLSDSITSEFEDGSLQRPIEPVDPVDPNLEAEVPQTPDGPELDIAIDTGFSLGLSTRRDGGELDGPDVSQSLATPSERLLSGLIDVAFVALIQLTLYYLTTNLVSSRLGALPTNAVVAMTAVGLVMAASYFLFFWSLSGQTLGKLLTGARVVDSRGGALGFAKSGLRLLGSLLALLPLGLGLIGLWTDSERRGWHDRLAGSLVVRG